MEKIDIKCNCGLTLQVDRTAEIPKDVVSMGCNWCPECMKDDDYYEEWYIYKQKSIKAN